VTKGGARRALGSAAVAPAAAIGWAFLGLLGLVVRIALFRRQGTQGAASVLWGLGFGLFLWFGAWSVGLAGGRALLFGLIGGAAIALFVYLRGAALENPPVERPGAFLGRLGARRRARRERAPRPPRTLQRRELESARVALAAGDRPTALFMLRQAVHVAVAQRRLGELLEARELAASIPTRGDPRTRAACDRLIHEIDRHLKEFPADELRAAGIRVETGRDRIRALLARGSTQGRAQPATPELARARAALDAGDLATALFMVREAQRVAIAQRRLEELLAGYELAEILAGRSDGRTRAASEALLRRAEASVLAFPSPG
jgi:hypothetical protein